MSSFTVNGRSVNISGVSGRNVVINNGRVVVDGKQIDLGASADEKVFNIVIQGDVDSISGEFANIEVTGNAGAVKSVAGDIHVAGSVNGGASTVSGDVKIGGNVGGSVSTISGGIKYRK